MGAGHFVRGVAPTPSSKILKKAVEDGVGDGGVDGPDGDEVAEDSEEIADSIGKALGLVNQVSISV